jgi:hypothetical protein
MPNDETILGIPSCDGRRILRFSGRAFVYCVLGSAGFRSRLGCRLSSLRFIYFLSVSTDKCGNIINLGGAIFSRCSFQLFTDYPVLRRYIVRTKLKVTGGSDRQWTSSVALQHLPVYTSMLKKKDLRAMISTSADLIEYFPFVKQCNTAVFLFKSSMLPSRYRPSLG